MKKNNVLSLSSPLFLIAVALFCGALLTMSVWPSIASQQEKKGNLKQESNDQGGEEYYGPIVEYGTGDNARSFTNQKEYNLRQVRSSRYIDRAPQPLDELASVEYSILTHWEIGLGPLPVAQSDAVVFGKVTDARAHLSNDRTGVYSEFAISIEIILKNSNPPIKDPLIVEREGGLVRFSSGRLLPYTIAHQRMPRLNRSYLFFLKANKQGEDYHIVTDYEVLQDRVSPLDESEKFGVFKGIDKKQFLNLVQQEVAEVSK